MLFPFLWSQLHAQAHHVSAKDVGSKADLEFVFRGNLSRS